MSDQEVMEESKVFINKTTDARHLKTLDYQKAEFERLWMKNKGGCSNSEDQNMYMYHSGNNLNSRQTAITTTATAKWVKNMSSTPLTKAQKQLLAHGPNFAIPFQSPSIGNTLQ